MRTMTKTLFTAAAAIAFGAAVHPSATLRSPNSSAEAGSRIQLQGEEFVPEEATTLLLRGALAEYELQDVTPGPDGTFDIELAIPDEVRPGQYRIVALASDGDASASLDIVITAASPAAHDDAGDDDHDEMSEMGAGGARADEMPIERSRSGMGWGLMGLLIGLAGGGGTMLLVRP